MKWHVCIDYENIVLTVRFQRVQKLLNGVVLSDDVCFCAADIIPLETQENVCINISLILIRTEVMSSPVPGCVVQPLPVEF